MGAKEIKRTLAFPKGKLMVVTPEGVNVEIGELEDVEIDIIKTYQEVYFYNSHFPHHIQHSKKLKIRLRGRCEQVDLKLEREEDKGKGIFANG